MCTLCEVDSKVSLTVVSCINLVAVSQNNIPNLVIMHKFSSPVFLMVH